MAFNTPFETGEQFLRDGHAPAGDDVYKSTRRNYAPDNRKLPPEPLRELPPDIDWSATPEAQLLASGEQVGIVQNTLWHADGGVVGGIVVEFSTPEWWGPAAAYDVWAADQNDFSAEDCFLKIGRIHAAAANKGSSYPIYHPFLVSGRTYIIAVVPVNSEGAGIDPNDAPQAEITLDDVGQLPPDITGFDVFPECCALHFEWDTVSSDNKNVAYYEIRQGLDYDSGALVCRVWGWAVGKAHVSVDDLPIPSLAPPGTGDTFHIKAVTGLGAESDTEGSDVLTADEIACLLTPCCTKAREILPPPGVDFVTITSLADAPVPPFVVPGHGAPGGGGGGGIPAWVDPASFTPNAMNPLRWDYTLHFGMTTVGGEVFPLTETT